MIMLEKDKLTIVIEGGLMPERWLDTVNELLDLFYCKSEEYLSNHQNVLLLLQEMMPDCKQAKALAGVMPEKEE